MAAGGSMFETSGLKPHNKWRSFFSTGGCSFSNRFWVISIGPAGKHQHRFLVGLHTFGVFRFDKEAAVNAALLLQAGVAIIQYVPACLSGNSKVRDFAGKSAEW